MTSVLEETSFKTPQDLQAHLLRRIEERGDMPGFSRSVQSIVNALAEADDEEQGDYRLIQVVLTDASLTQKVLRLANSAMYAVFEGQVTTVTRAVALLGTQTVAHLALGLKVIESFEGEGGASDAIKGEMDKAMLSGVLGRQFASCTASTRDSEEAAVVSVLHNLGRMLVSFYLPKSFEEIRRLQSEGATEVDACLRVLSSDYPSVAQFVGSRWGLPETLVNALRPSPEALTRKMPLTHDDWLCMVGQAAIQGAQILYEAEGGQESSMAAMMEEYAPRLGVEVRQMQIALESARSVIQETLANKPIPVKQQEQDRNRALSAGLAELKEAAKTMVPNQVVALAVEFLHQALAANKSFYFLKSAKEKCYRAKLGLGEGAAPLVSALRFDEQFRPDVFHAVMASERICYVENTRASTIKQRLPLWWLGSLGTAQSFCVIPMTLNRMPLGFLYFDWGAEPRQRQLQGYALEVLAEVRTVISDCIEKTRRASLAQQRAVPA